MRPMVLQMSRRERGKTERKRRIVDATLSLVREQGIDDISIVQIAERAEVGAATVYNLFGSKSAIFRAIFDRETQQFEDRVARAGSMKPVDKIFMAVEFVVECVERDPKFQRAVAYACGRSEEELAAAVTKRRISFYVEMLSAAVAAGQLRSDAEPDLLGVTLANLISGTALIPTSDILENRLAARMNYGVAVFLHAFATKKSAPALRLRFASARAELLATTEPALAKSNKRHR